MLAADSGDGTVPGGRLLRRAPPLPAGSQQQRPHGTGRRAPSLPVPREFPRHLQLVGLAAKGPLELADPALEPVQLSLLRGLLPRVRQGRLAAVQQPLAPLVVQGLGDLVLATHLADAAVASQPSQDDLSLLLWRELPILALLAQPTLPGLGATMIPSLPAQESVNAAPGSSSLGPVGDGVICATPTRRSHRRRAQGGRGPQDHRGLRAVTFRCDRMVEASNRGEHARQPRRGGNLFGNPGVTISRYRTAPDEIGPVCEQCRWSWGGPGGG